MNKLEAISTRLESKEIETLKKYYQMSQSINAQHFYWEQINEELSLDYSSLKSLAVLGFVHLEKEEKSRESVYNSYYLTLYPSAMARAEYENYSKIKKWVVRKFLNYRDWISVVGFIISVILAVLKVIEFMNQP